MPVDVHWNHCHPWEADHPKKCFYRIFLEHTQGIDSGGFSSFHAFISSCSVLCWLCCLPFCKVSLVPAGKQLKDQDIAGALSEAGLHYCRCENLFSVEVARDGCSDCSMATAGTSAVLWSSLLLEGACHSHFMRSSTASCSLQLSNSHPSILSLWTTCSSAVHPHPSGDMVWCSLCNSFPEWGACSDQHSKLLRKT